MKQIKNYFSNLLDPQLLIIVLTLGVLCIALTLIFSKKVSDFKKYKINFYIYLFLVVFIYSVIAFLGYNRLLIGKHSYEFVFYQICTLSIGIIHCYVYRVFFEEFEQKDNFLQELLFALLVVLYASFPFVVIYTFLSGMAFTLLMLGHFILFFVPTLLSKTFDLSMKIPPKVYVTWQFPENYREKAGVSDEEMRDLVVFTFLMKKDKEAIQYTSYRAKGPTRIDFGRLFYNFIIDYNERYPETPIQTEDENGLFNWVFFLQPKWYEPTKYIDPKYTLYMNGIEENSVIICMRTDKVVSAEEDAQNPETDFEYNREKDNQRISSK